MFDNIGGKIKSLATITTVLGIIASVIWGFYYLTVVYSPEFSDFLVALFIMAVGSLASWIGSFVLYGFGQLIENTDVLAEKAIEDDTSSRYTYGGGSGSYTDHGWICKRCNTRNETSRVSCKNCGMYK